MIGFAPPGYPIPGPVQTIPAPPPEPHPDGGASSSQRPVCGLRLWGVKPPVNASRRSVRVIHTEGELNPFSMFNGGLQIHYARGSDLVQTPRLVHTKLEIPGPPEDPKPVTV